MRKPDIFTYLDYRKYLRDAQEFIKSRSPEFTYRNITAQAGLKSPGHITWIMQGKRNITKKQIPVFAEIFRLNEKETGYFDSLVRFNNAGQHAAKKACFDEIVAQQKYEKRIVDTRQLRYWSSWYHAAVRELVEIFTVTDGNFKDAAHLLVPHISPREMQQSLRLLSKIGFIKKDANGRYRRVDKVITSGADWKTLAVHEYQINVMDLGKEALSNIDKDERDISTVTLSISEDRFSHIRRRIQEFREELITLARTEDNPERIYQFGLMFFPISESKGRGPQSV